MARIQNLLAATDFSAPARHAAARAVRLTRITGAQLTLLHVMSQSAVDRLRDLLGAETASVEQRLMDQAQGQLQRLADEIAQPHGVPASVRLSVAPLLNEITAQADSIDADLLVMGARGENFMRHLLLGSTSERLLRRTSRPILVVKQLPIDDYQRVLLPVDFSPWSREALMLAQKIAPRAELIVLHAFDVPFESKLHYAGVEEHVINDCRARAKKAAFARLRALVADAGLDPSAPHYCVLHGNATRHIIEQEQEEDCDLIVLGKHGQSKFEELLLGSVTKHVLAESTCDVVVSALATS